MHFLKEEEGLSSTNQTMIRFQYFKNIYMPHKDLSYCITFPQV